MICNQCGRNNPEAVAFCGYCGASLGVSPAAPTDPASSPYGPPPAKPSGAAIASIVLGVLGFCSVGITGVIGLVVGIVALRQIGASDGRVTGKPAAIAGIVVSLLSLLIIPIMAAILFPVFAQAREKARSTSCLSNVKQLSLGVLMYTQDYDEKMPMARNWSDGIDPYIKNRNLYKCPSAPAVSQGYGYNAKLDKAKMADVAAPAQSLMLFEMDGTWNASGGPEAAVARHEGRLSVGFVDGHARLMPLNTIQSNIGITWDPKGQPTYGGSGY